MNKRYLDDATSSPALWRHARAHGYERQLKDLHRRRGILATAAIALDYLLIGVSVVATIRWGWAAFLPAALVVGNRQRALVVLIHDASHRLLFATTAINDRVAACLLCFPMLISLSRYRKLHVQHHQHLGDPVRDTDYLHSEELIARGWWATYRSQLFGASNCRTALLGMLPRMTWPERLMTAGWWAVLLVSIGTLCSPSALAMFVALWLSARLFVYHPIISFVIISDHVGLVPGTVVGFTRNHPASWLARWIHPHSNGWHLTHHLLPGLPFHALHRAHAVLMQWPPYRDAEHCDAYFRGRISVIASWCRKTQRFSAAAASPATFR